LYVHYSARDRFWPIAFILPDREHAKEMPFHNDNNGDDSNNNAIVTMGLPNEVKI